MGQLGAIRGIMMKPASRYGFHTGSDVFYTIHAWHRGKQSSMQQWAQPASRKAWRLLSVTSTCLRHRVRVVMARKFHSFSKKNIPKIKNSDDL